jgi:hypothetical protein
MIRGDSAGAGGDIVAFDREAGLGERSNDFAEPFPGFWFGDRGAVPRRMSGVSGVETTADQQTLGVNLQVVAHAWRDLGEAALVGLVRRLVPGEPDVAMGTKHRHLGIEPGRGVGEQRRERFAHRRLVDFAVGRPVGL